MKPMQGRLRLGEEDHQARSDKRAGLSGWARASGKRHRTLERAPDMRPERGFRKEATSCVGARPFNSDRNRTIPRGLDLLAAVIRSKRSGDRTDVGLGGPSNLEPKPVN
jgi:hypothetical protein